MKISARDLKTFDLAINAWKHEGTDKQLTNVYEKDRIALRKILNRMKKGDIKGARKLMDGLDSILRDMIPEKLYNKFYKFYR